MTSIKCYETLKYFVLVFLTINIIYADPIDDYNECMRQLRFAYNNHESSTDCFRHAVKYYKKGENIPVKSNLISNQSQNVTSSSNKSQTFSNSHIEVNSFGDQLYSGQTDTSIYNFDSFNDLSKRAEFLDPPIYVGSFEDLQFIAEGDPSIYNYDSSNDLSKRAETTFNVDNFQDSIFTTQADPKIQAKQFGDSSQTVQADEQHKVPDDHNKDIINYAVQYFAELEKMAQGNGVMGPPKYCNKFHLDNYFACTSALDLFGSTPKSAVRVALTTYNLSECFGKDYIYEYMNLIIDEVLIKSPSKAPKTFCTEVYNRNSYWIEKYEEATVMNKKIKRK